MAVGVKQITLLHKVGPVLDRGMMELDLLINSEIKGAAACICAEPAAEKS